MRVKWVLFALALIAIILWRLPWDRYFAIKTIVIESGERMAAETLQNLIDIRAGDSLFGVDLKAARQKLLGQAWVRDAKLSRRFLSRSLKVEIIEREPFGVVFAKGRYLLLDREGFVLERLKDKPPLFISGIETVETPRGERLKSDQAIRALQDFFSFDHRVLAQFTELRLNGDGEAVLLAGVGFKVLLKVERMRESLRTLERLLKTINASKYSYMDLRFEKEVILMPRPYN